MAADFPPNLDDGELWLPSEIIPDVGVCRRRHRQRYAAVVPGYPSDLGYIEDLARQLAAFGLLDRSLPSPPLKPRPNLSPHPERYVAGGPAVRLGLTERELGAGLGYDVIGPPPALRVGTGAYFPGPRPVQQFNPGKPVRAQTDGFGLARARVLQRPPNRFVPPVRLGGSGRECGGTGVFLPRVAVDKDIRKKPTKLEGMKGVEQQRQSTRSAAERRQVVVPLQPSTPEMGLPQDWTY